MKYEEFITYAERLRSLGVEGFILTGGGGAYRKSCLYDDYGVDGKRGNPLRNQHEL